VNEPTRDQTEQEMPPTPSMEELAEWVFDSMCEARCPHRCIVEHDGHCPHGNPSWLLYLGLGV
jgi:hypothetical protein